MKTILLIICIIVLTGLTGNIYSQRNLNQKQFKSKRSFDYDKLEENNDFMYFIESPEQQAGYQQLAAPGGSAYIRDNEIVFTVRSLMNVEADRFLAVFNLTQVGETTASTDDVINSRINGFKNGIKELGIGDDDIYIDMIYLIPTFEYEVDKKLFSKTYNEVPTGFEMQKNVHVSFDNIDIVDDLVTIAAKNEIYDLVKLDFFIENTEAVYDTLRDVSVDCVKKKVSSFKNLNIELNDKFNIIREMSHAIYPESQYSDYDAFVSQSIEALKKKTGVTSIRKPQTVAYDQIPYENFDIIINPAIKEPVVQYVYVLCVKYTLEPPDLKEKNN